MKLRDCALLIIANIVGFYVLKGYNDTRQVRTVSACKQVTVELAAIGPIIKQIPYVKFKGNEVIEVGFHYKKTGFGQMNSGTGVFVSNDGLILTCAHVTHKSPLMQVSLNGFYSDALDEVDLGIKRRKLFAYVVARDEEADLALLRVIYPGQYFGYAKLRNSVEVGLPVFTIGFPSIFEKHVTAGIISSFMDGWTYTDVVMEHGSSGGGLFDADGRLLGLADFMHYPANYSVFQGFSGFTDLDEMHNLMDKYEDF